MNDAGVSRLPWPSQLAFAALTFQAFFAMTHFGHWLRPEYGGAAALLILAVTGHAHWRALARHPLSWAVLAFIAYAVLQAAFAARLTPEVPFAKYLTENAKPIHIGVLTCAIGMCLAERPRRIPWLLALMVAGFVIAALVYIPWSNLHIVTDGALRLRFDYAENIVGEFSAISLLLLWLYAMSRPARGRATVLAGLVVVGLLLLACLLYAQSRAAWIAAVLLIPAAAIARARDLNAHWGRSAAIAIGVAALAAVAVLCVGYGIVAQRLGGGDAIVSALTDGSLVALPHTPVSVRLQLAALGLHAWYEHPFLGNGLHNIAAMIAARGIHIGNYVPPHLHDAYLQATVGLGGIGAALLLAAFGILIRELWLARRARQVGSALYWALLGSLGIVLVVNVSDCLLWRVDYMRAPAEILLGACFAVSLRRRAAFAATT